MNKLNSAWCLAIVAMGCGEIVLEAEPSIPAESEDSVNSRDIVIEEDNVVESEVPVAAVTRAWPAATAISGVVFLADTFAIEPGRALFVGAGGALYGVADGELRQLESPTDSEILGVWAPDATAFYLAGDAGLHFWDGTKYHHVASGPRFNDVWGLPGGARVWAVGEEPLVSGAGLVYRGFETEFAEEYRVRQDGSYPRGLNAVWASATGEVVAGGWAEDGALWRRGEQGWTPESPLGPVTYNAVHGRDGEIWVVGFKYSVVHWDGIEWTASGIGSQYVHGVFATGPGSAWVAGDEGLYRFEGDMAVERELADINVEGLHGTGPQDIWAVGGEIHAGGRGWIYHYDGFEWTETL